MASTKLYLEYLPFMNIHEANSILETGSGPGNGIPIILNLIKPTCILTVTDISTGFLKHLKAQENANVISCEANIENLPFDSNSFDRYISNMAIHNVDDPKIAIQEACRVLKPDGILGFSTFSIRNNTYMDLMKIFRQFINVPYHDTILQNLSLMSNVEDFRNFVLRLGFRHVMIYTIKSVYPFSTPEEAADLYLSFDKMVNFQAENPHKAGELVKLVHDKLHELLILKGEPIGFDATIVIAYK